MIHVQNMESETLIIPASVATNATATGILDTLDSDYVAIDVINNTSATALSVLKIEEGDTTSSFTAIATLTGGTDTNNFTIPSADTSAAPNVRFNIDCRRRKRYLKLSITPGEATIVGAQALHSRVKETPTNAPGAVVTA